MIVIIDFLYPDDTFTFLTLDHVSYETPCFFE